MTTNDKRLKSEQFINFVRYFLSQEKLRKEVLLWIVASGFNWMKPTPITSAHLNMISYSFFFVFLTPNLSLEVESELGIFFSQNLFIWKSEWGDFFCGIVIWNEVINVEINCFSQLKNIMKFFSYINQSYLSRLKKKHSRRNLLKMS